MLNNPTAIQWAVLHFRQLDARLLHDILRLRIDVFVVEQQCAYPELDGADLQALHLIGRSAGAVVACARILPPGADGLPHVGRVAVARELRAQGMGSRLMQEVLAALRKHHGSARSALAAQAHLLAFYRHSGYAPVGDPYPLDGIPHVDMVRSAD